MQSERWMALCDYAISQHGLVTSEQAGVLGIDDNALLRATEVGLLDHPRRGVYCVRGVPPTEWRPLMAACLAGGPDAQAAYRAAGWLYGLPAILPGHIEVLLPKDWQAELGDVVCHRTTTWRTGHRTTVRNIPCTTIERTIIDLAAVLASFAIRQIAGHAERRGLCIPADVLRCLDDIGSRGRRGAKKLRAMLEDHVSGGSELEARWLRLLRREGLFPPALQYQVVIQGRVFLLDGAWPDKKVGIEIDGWDPHRTRSAFDHDATRGNLLLAAGWRIVHITAKSEPTTVLHLLHSLLGE